MDRRPTQSTFSRRIETIWVGIALFLYSGAIFPLLMTGADGILDIAERERLRLLFLPVYALTLFALARRPALTAMAVSRNWPMLMLMLVPIASTAWAISHTITIRRSVALVLSMAFAYVFATRFAPRQQLRLLSFVLGGTVLLSLAMAAAMPGLAFMPGGEGLRGVFTHKNVMGWSASVTFLLGFAFLYERGPAAKWAGCVLIVIGSAGTIMSGSATAHLTALSAAVAIMAVHFVSRQTPVHRPFATFLILIAGVMAAGSMIFVVVPILELLGKDASLTGRVPLWSLVDAEIYRKPFLGYGFGTYWSEANPGAWHIWSTLQWRPPHAHNGYRDLLLGTGILGLILFIAVALRALRQSWLLCLQSPHDSWLWCFSLIVGTLVMNWSESTFLMQNDLFWVLFVTAALTASMHSEEAHVVQPHFAKPIEKAT